MTIPLPSLPAPQSYFGGPVWYQDDIRTIQREAMLVALEAAAKQCEDIYSFRPSYFAGLSMCAVSLDTAAEAIRALKPTPPPPNPKD